MPTQIVIVDTNCFVRLYFSPLRPLLGREVVGHTLLTLRELADETRHLSGLTLRHPWVGGEDVQDDLAAAILSLSAEADRHYEADATYYRREAEAFLQRICALRGLAEVRLLSHADAKALAVALDRGYVLATDEWPLREFSQFVEPDDHGRRLPLLNSLQLLKLFLDAGQLDHAGIRQTVRAWVLCAERLPRDWRHEYRRLFLEDPPSGQG